MLLGFARYRQLSPRRGAGRRKAGLREADGERAAYAMFPGSRGISTVDYQRDRKARLVAFTPGAITTPRCATGGLGKPGERSADLRDAAFRDLRTAALCRPLDDTTPHAADASRRGGMVGGTVLARLREHASLLRKLGQLNIGCPPAATILSRAPGRYAAHRSCWRVRPLSVNQSRVVRSPQGMAGDESTRRYCRHADSPNDSEAHPIAGRWGACENSR